MDRNRNAGFTLLQAMVCLTILAVLVAVAVPTWRGALAATHAAAAEASLMQSLASAITSASVSGHEVVLCPASSDDCLSTWEWSDGWIAFVDHDGDRHHDGSERVLERIGPLAGGTRLFTSTGRRRIVIQPNGGNSGSNATFTLCPGGSRPARQLVLSNRGQLRSARIDRGQPTICTG